MKPCIMELSDDILWTSTFLGQPDNNSHLNRNRSSDLPDPGAWFESDALEFVLVVKHIQVYGLRSPVHVDRELGVSVWILDPDQIPHLRHRTSGHLQGHAK